MGKRILLVDDEPLILKGLKYTLEQDGYETDTAVDGQEALDKFFSGVYDLVLLDVMLPKVDGLSVCQRIRETSSVPIIMLTAKGEDMDKILGLEYGADDYMTKPFNILEVRARIRTVLRRAGGHVVQEQKIIRVHDMEVNLVKRTVTLGGEEVRLTAKEFDLLQMFITNRGRPTIIPATRARWTCTSAACARRLSATPMNRSLSSRNGRWATISPTRTKPLAALVRGAMSLRWKLMLTFLVVIGASFAIMASILTGMVSSTLYQQRTRQATRSLEQLASSAAPFLASAQMDGLSELLTAQAGELGGRLLAVDMDGKVQADTFGARSGQRLSIPETVAVLLHGEKSAFGIHRVDSESGVSYVAVASAVMEVSGKTLGALVLSLPVDELQSALETVERQLMTVFLIIAGAAMAAALMLSGMLTRPVKALTQTIRRMGKGDLSARVNVRTSGELKELAESYNAMAEQIGHLDKSRSQFVANASHELKTPLATMKLLLENMLYQPDMPQELRTEFMQDINHEIDRLSGIITDLLTLTQMDSHSSPLRVTKVDLSALTEETVHTLQIAAEKKGQTLTADIAPGITLDGDSGKLMQIFYNLTDNAIKYTPENGHIAVRLAQSGANVLFAVTDDGIGIPEEDQKHIFERFYRVDKARSRATGGTGLGLSIVRQLAAMHGGTVSVSSQPGQGATFTVTLPMDAKRGEKA